MSSPKRIFVTAATGTIGNAVAHELLRRGFKVHALVRDPESHLARGLATAGAQLFTGDWDDEEALKKSLAGCDGLFMNLMPSFADLTSERRHGLAIVAIARQVGVQQAIYSSVLNTDPPQQASADRAGSGLAIVLENKRVLEDAVRGGGFEAYTILRPAFFMANWLAPKVDFYGDLRKTGTWTTVLSSDSRLPLIDERDVASFVAAAFADPSRFAGCEIHLASEVTTLEEVISRLSRVTGRELKTRLLSDEEIAARAEDDMAVTAQLRSARLIELVDMDEVRAWGIPLHSFQEYLEWQKELVLKSYTLG